jgi:hypothetical protein
VINRTLGGCVGVRHYPSGETAQIRVENGKTVIS